MVALYPRDGRALPFVVEHILTYTPLTYPVLPTPVVPHKRRNYDTRTTRTTLLLLNTRFTLCSQCEKSADNARAPLYHNNALAAVPIRPPNDCFLREQWTRRVSNKLGRTKVVALCREGRSDTYAAAT